MPKRNRQIQFKATEEENAMIEERAQIVGMNKSDYLRSIALADDKVIILDKGGDIAYALSELLKICTKKFRNSSPQENDVVDILNKLDEIYQKFDFITEQLTDIHYNQADEEGGGLTVCQY